MSEESDQVQPERDTPSVDDLRGQYNIPEQLRREIKNEILQMILVGHLAEEIRPIIQDKYDITYQTAKRYCDDVYVRIKKAKSKVADDTALNLTLAIGRLQFLYRQAMQRGQLRVASDALKQLHALQGLVPDSRPGVNINIAAGSQGHLGASQGLQTVPTEVLMAEYDRKRLPEPVREIPKRLTVDQAYAMEVEG